MPRSTRSVVVSDSGPLIALGRLDLLHAAIGLVVIGTLRVLVLARRAGHVGAIGPLVDALRVSGQRLSNAAVAQALAAVSEAAQ